MNADQMNYYRDGGEDWDDDDSVDNDWQKL